MTAACMAERGFEYIPYVPQSVIDGIQARHGEDRIEVSANGAEYWTPRFPMETSPGSVKQEEQALELSGRTGFNVFFEPEGVRPQPPTVTPDNPNAAIVAGLRDAAVAEYFRALQGYAPEDVNDGSLLTENQQAEGCMAVARRRAGPEPLPPERLDAIDIEKLTDLGSKVSLMVTSDPRLASAESERVQCLAERGVPPNPYEYVLGLLQAELKRLTGDTHGTIEGQGTEQGMANAFGADRLRELQQEELAVAVAANECAMILTRVERELIAEYEQQILDENPEVAALLNE